MPFLVCPRAVRLCGAKGEVPLRVPFTGRQFSSFQVIGLSFLALIAAGTLLLMLPFATQSGEGAPFLTALFTTVSASCVTGLTVENTALYWSMFGQLVLLLLIQVGGLGVVTMAVAVTVASGRKVGFMQRSTMQEAVAAPQLGGIVLQLRFILLFTFGCELLGALLLLPVFVRDYGWCEGGWLALFHAVSAFCNAGFDLLGERAGGSLMAYAADPLVNLVVVALILAGGLGFITWGDLRLHGRHLSRCRLQTKIILLMTAVLVIVPTAIFYMLEFPELQGAARFWASLFQAVTPRTAGFNTVDIEAMSETGRLLLVTLMFTGGAPGSTAGGIKTTTLFVLLATMASSLRLKKDVELTHLGRRISLETVRRALTIFLVYLVLLLLVTVFISYHDSVPLMDAMVETASALGTVGLSIGLTEHLSSVSQLLLCGLMYFGRMGALTLIYAMHTRREPVPRRLPEGAVTVG